MPTLPIPYPFYPGGGDLPVSDEDDVRKAYPAHARGPAVDAPVREALVAGQTAMFLAWQERSAFAAIQSDPTRAEGSSLDGHGEDRPTFRQTGEDDDAFRARMLAVPDIVTPKAILAAADAILAPYTDIPCQYFESALDRVFINDGTTHWHSFLVPVDPEYGDRHYELRPQSHPGNAWVFSDSIGHFFVLRVPVLESLEGSHAYPLDGTVAEDEAVEGVWIADGNDTGGSESGGAVASFVSTGFGTALDVYQAVANTVSSIVGQSVRWQMIADANLE